MRTTFSDSRQGRGTKILGSDGCVQLASTVAYFLQFGPSFANSFMCYLVSVSKIYILC